jgi:hypothetical protein
MEPDRAELDRADLDLRGTGRHRTSAHDFGGEKD